MILHIGVAKNNCIEIVLKQENKPIVKKRFKAGRREAEKLLPAVEALLKAEKIDLKRINEIRVADGGGSFTSLRVRVVTANALAYALGVRVRGESGREKKIRSGKSNFSVVEPVYGREPAITEKQG